MAQRPPSVARRCVAEFIGTFGLLFAGAGAVMINEISGGAITNVGIGLVFGLVVAAMIFSLGHISGAHINPAVTLGFALARHFPWKMTPLYWGSQLMGATAACLVLRGLFGNVADVGATLPGSEVWVVAAFEALLTFFLMFVIMAMATDVRAVGTAAALAIGATVGLESIFGGPISGASMNPARSFGPALVSGNWTAHWAYWVGPAVGAAVAAFTYAWLREQNTMQPGEEQ